MRDVADIRACVIPCIVCKICYDDGITSTDDGQLAEQPVRQYFTDRVVDNILRYSWLRNIDSSHEHVNVVQ
jgi:hypothetical protein